MGQDFNNFTQAGVGGYNDLGVNCFAVLCNAMEVKEHPIFVFVWYDPL